MGSTKQGSVAPGSLHIVTMGRVGAPFGIKGHVHIQSFTKEKAQLLDYEPWYLKLKGRRADGTSGKEAKEGSKSIESWQIVAREDARIHGKGLVAKFACIDDRDEAARLTNVELGVLRSSLPKLPKGEFYWVDLIGLEVINSQGRNLGKVTELFETGSNDVLVVKGAGGGGEEYLIPFVFESYVVDVDFDAKKILVNWEMDT